MTTSPQRSPHLGTRPVREQATTKGSGMSELSREQVERLRDADCECGHWWEDHRSGAGCDFLIDRGPGPLDPCPCVKDPAQALAPTVAAMLDEARAEGWRAGFTAAADIVNGRSTASAAAGAPPGPREASVGVVVPGAKTWTTSRLERDA